MSKLFKEKLQVHFHPTDIHSLFRLRGRNGRKQTSETGDIILTVATYRKKLEIFRAKKNLKMCEGSIYINESLTPKQGELFAATRDMVKNKSLNSTWTRYGKIYIRQQAEGRPMMIYKKEDLIKLDISAKTT